MKKAQKISIVLLVLMLTIFPVFCNTYTEIKAEAATDLYEKLSNSVNNIESSINVTGWGITKNNISEIMENFRQNYARYFYFSNVNYNYDKNNQVTKITWNYLYTKKEIQAMKTKYENAVKAALSCTSAKMTDMEKVTAIHDYLALHTRYDYVNYKKDTVPQTERKSYSVLVDGLSVCAGYAYAFCDLMGRLGIKCIYITSEGMNHAWNMVQVDGKWYHIDVTWDDPSYLQEKGWKNDDDEIDGRVSHSFLLLSDDKIKELNHYGWESNAPKATSKIYETAYANIVSGMFYCDGLWYYCEKGELIKSDIALKNKNKVTEAAGCTYLYLVGDTIYYTRDNKDKKFSEIRRVKADGSGDTAVLRYDNNGKTVSDNITEFVVEGGQMKYTVNSISADKTTNKYAVKVFNIASLISISENNYYKGNPTLNINAGTATFDGADVKNGTVLTGEGKHALVLTDTAGNSISIDIIIDSTKPIITGVEEGKSYNKGQKITFNEGTATLDGKAFKSGTAVKTSGTHTLVVTDEAGNATQVSFTVNASSIPFVDIGSIDFDEDFLLILFITICGIVIFYIILYNIVASAVYRGMKAFYKKDMELCVKDIENKLYTANKLLDISKASLEEQMNELNKL